MSGKIKVKSVRLVCDNESAVKVCTRKRTQSVFHRTEGDHDLVSTMLGVEPGTAVRVNPGSWEKIADPQDLVIFNQTRKESSRFMISQEGRLKSHPSFTSRLQNNLFRETVFFTFTIRQKTRE
jgi:hypothetical protein